jgi:alanine racemase
MPATRRPTFAEVDLAALEANAGVLATRVAPAKLCAVVKANAYGHGAVPAARTAIAGGAEWLAVALIDEAAVLRAAGIDAPVLVLTECTTRECDEAVRQRVRATVSTRKGAEDLAEAVRRVGASPQRVHLKVDTGMHRGGVAPRDAVDLARYVARNAALRLEAAWTHFAVADDPARPETDRQLQLFLDVLAAMDRAGVRPQFTHAANSAAALSRPDTRFDMVRCGIALYGIAPGPALNHYLEGLRPVMRVKSQVVDVKIVPAGEGVSYGPKRPFSTDTRVAVVPIGYADGLPRRLADVGAQVLIRGRRRPFAGAITMDQVLIECGPADHPLAIEVRRGDEVVLLGEQGDDNITAEGWASLLGTIGYEVVSTIGPRVPRTYV